MKRAARRLLRLLPRTRAFDFVHSLIFFVYAHGRWPRRDSGLFNDYLFFLRNSPCMADALRQITSDKVYSKLFIDQISGRKVTPETYAVFTSVDQIDRRALPDRCILKTAHASGCVVFLAGPDAELLAADRRKLAAGLAFDAYREHREVNYKHIRKRIICEELLDSPDTIKDYKFLYYKGKLRFIQVDSGRHSQHKQNFYDAAWQRIHVTFNSNPWGEWESAPARFDEMKQIGEKISRHFESVRVDFYIKDEAPYVGEITHCHFQANGKFGSIEEERTISRIYFGSSG